MEDTVGGVGLVALGGFVGAIARHGVELVAIGLGSPAATATLAVNVAGAFALGFLVTRAVGQGAQLLFGTGALSSFTTYSTFAADAALLGTTWGVLYVVASYGLGIAAAVLGLTVGRSLR